ncbi:MAG: hypothetical protein E7218_02370 [Anaerofustis stercorihominis]|nr:hypothetical protein [Anaerofustis stercorihominis]
MQTSFRKIRSESKRIIAMLLAMAMVFSAVPTGVLAEDTPFSAISTSDGNTVEVIREDSVSYSNSWGSSYDDIPHYLVQIPEGTEAVKVTYPADISLQLGEDYTTKKPYAYGYYADTSMWSGDGAQFEYVKNADETVTVTIPMEYISTDWDGTVTELNLLDGYAVAVEYDASAANAPVNFFTFEYVTATEEPEVPVVPDVPQAPEKIHTKVMANGEELSAEDVVYQTSVDFTSRGGMEFEAVPYYNVNVPQGTEKVIVTYDGNDYASGLWTSDGKELKLDTVTSATINGYSAEVTVSADGTVEASNAGGPALQATGDNDTYTDVQFLVENYALAEGEDGTKTGNIVSVQTGPDAEKSYAPVEFFSFTYTDEVILPEGCIEVSADAPEEIEVSAGGLYKLALGAVFNDSKHEITGYEYEIAEEGYSETHTKIDENGIFNFCAPKEGDVFNITLTAECAGGEKISHNIKATITKANEGIDAQYGYDETDKSSVTVYVTLSNDGVPIMAADGETVMSNLKVTVPYFDLASYGLEDYYRYGTENGRGDYVNENLIQRPTGLHLYIYLIERYYMGLAEEQCCIGTSGVLEYVSENDVLYMDGEVAYESNGLKALYTSGGAKSIYMVNFWGHDENLMYYRNHCYPYMGPGWGATSDYMLLSDGDTWDVGMFTDWGFNVKGGGFVSFDKDEYKAKAGETLKVDLFKWGTSETAKDFEAVNGSVGLGVALYDSEWEVVVDAECEYTSDDDNEITVTIPEGLENGTYYIMATDPDATTKDAKFAPGVSRIVVGEEQVEAGDGDVTRILLDKYEATIDTTQKLQLSASVIPAEATDKTVTWTSSEESVATVDANGLVTPLKAGETTITVTAVNGVKASCEVTVTRYNTAPTLAAGFDTTLKIKTGETKEFVVADLFEDAQNDELEYSVAVKEATSVGGSWDTYNYAVINDADTTITDGKFTYAPTEKGIYQVVFTADDGMATAQYAFQFTVVDDDSGRIELAGGAVADIYNVVVVDHSVEFVEDCTLPYKGTHDTYVHNIVLSKDTLAGGPSKIFDLILDEGVVWQQYDNGYNSAGTNNNQKTRADFAFFIYNKTGEDVTKYAHYFVFKTECQQHTNNDDDHICDVCTMKVSECADADNDGACDVCGKYIVTINVGPSTANVTFYSGSDTTTALTTEVKDNGEVDGYHQYVLNVAEGTYTYRGTDGETDLGGMTFKVPLSEEIMSDGTASGEGQSMTLRQVNYYTTNANITNAGDYTLNLIPAGLPDVVNGEQYIDDNNRVVTPVLVMARGNALVYQQSVAINGELGETYAVAPVSNVTFTAGNAVQNKTFSLAAIVRHTVTAPEGAKVQVFNQINNFNVEEITTKTVSEADENGIVTHTFKTSGGGNLTYRVSMDGKVTRAGYFGNTAETINVTFEENEDPKATGHKLDNANIQKRMEASTMLNVNAQNNLRIDKDETFRLRGYRGAWQIINSDTANIMIEPDFHYNIISGEEHIKVDVVDDVCTGNATGNWMDITGVSEGTAIVEITYDAIQIGGNGTTYDGFYGATDPQRKGLVVIQVGEGENTLKMTAEGSSNVWDVEFDTVYFMDETGSMTFTATMGEDIPEKAELSVDNGKTWSDVTFADGKFTADGLVGGNNILRFTKGDVTEYQIVRAAKVTRTVTNLSRAEGIIAGDQIKVVYEGLYTPVSKISGIYNPGFGQGHAITYNVPDGYTVSTTGGQYDFISTNSYTITIPETANGEVKLTGGYIAFNIMGGEPGLHRMLTDAGCGANFSAGNAQHTRCVLPDIEFTVTDMPYIDVTVKADVEGTTIVVKDSTGTELKAEDGVYNLPLGTYSYTASLDGYITERSSFDVTMADAANKTKTVSVKMRKVEGAVWDGKTTTTPQKDANGVYQISTGGELAWFATNHNNANAVLTADISLGGFDWTPIVAYSGTFDGNGHWVTDLYINSTSKGQGLFAQLSSDGMISNLGVRGQVTSTANNAGGIVGTLRNNATVEGCISDVTVTGSQYVGGIAGQQYMSSTIRNCYNIGDVTATKSNAGGISGGYIVASQAFTIKNCYNLGVVTAPKNYGALTYSTKAANGVNSYYIGSNGDSSIGTEVTVEQLKGMAGTLGKAYAADKNNINGGYPILTWQVVEEPQIKYGDVNGDNQIDTNDVSDMLKYINGTGDAPFTEAQRAAADVNGDDQVDTNDVSVVLQYINGSVDKLPYEG